MYFTTLDAMIRALAIADRSGRLEQKLRTYTTKSQLLVLDEVGYLPLSRAETNYLFQVVSARYEHSSVVLTSNKAVTRPPAPPRSRAGCQRPQLSPARTRLRRPHRRH